MKRKINPPVQEENSLQAIVDYLIDNGLGEFNTNMFIHTNLPSLGGDKSIINCVQEDDWETAWASAKLYISGDMW